MALFAYTRSTATDDGSDLRKQQAAVRAYADRQNLTIDHVFQDAESAQRTPLFQRPEGRQLQARLRPGDAVILPRPGVAFRDLRDGAQALQCLLGWRVHVHVAAWGHCFVPGSGTAAWLLFFLQNFEGWRQEQLAESARRARARSRALGRKFNAADPIGFSWRGCGRKAVLVPDEAEQSLMRLIAGARRQGLPWYAIYCHVRDSRRCPECATSYPPDERTRQPARTCARCGAKLRPFTSPRTGKPWSYGQVVRYGRRQLQLDAEARAAQPAG
jgi:hypothetical protein